LSENTFDTAVKRTLHTIDRDDDAKFHCHKGN
jgi:hypothetical protein